MGEFETINESRSEMLRGVRSHFDGMPFSFRPFFQSNPPGGGGEGGGTGGAGGEGGGSGAGAGSGSGTGGAGGTGGTGGEGDGDDEDGDDEDPAEWDKSRAATTIKAQREEAKRLRDQLKEAKRLAQEGETAKAKLAEQERAKLGDVERTQAERDQEKTRADNAEAALKAERVNGALLAAASKLNAVDLETVAALVPRDQIEYDDDGKPKNVEKLVKAVLDAKPFLKKPEQNGQVPGTPGGSGNGKTGLDPEAKKAAEQGAAELVRGSF
jgi:hypothetical protein